MHFDVHLGVYAKGAKALTPTAATVFSHQGKTLI